MPITLEPLFLIAIVVTLAAFLGSWFAFFRLPLILAYILTGIILGPFLFNDSNPETFNLLQDLGLSFLLFLVGLEIKTSELRQFGKQAIQTGFAQIFGTLVLGFVLALLIGFTATTAFYVAAALTFSSTVIVVKILNEKRDVDSLYGKISIAILLLQDLFAIVLLILLSGLGRGGQDYFTLVLSFLFGFLLFGVVYLLNQKVLPYLFERLARNLELLFLSSIAWLLIVVSVSSLAGFSIEIGAFLAGLGLASLKEEHQIAARVRPLRDFFIVLFFIILGSHIVLNWNLQILLTAFVLSGFVLVIKPLLVTFFLGRLGFRRRVGFMAGITLAQISEFSLVIMFLGLKIGVLTEEVVGIVTLTALITIAVSSYVITYSTKVYKKVERYLKFFESSRVLNNSEVKNQLENHIVLVGAGRLGWEIFKQLEMENKPLLVVDFNPTIINVLKEKGIDHLFGDITDPEIWEGARIEKASLVISTVFDPEDNEEILDNLKDSIRRPIVFLTAAEREWALDYYKRGADYVIVPRVLSGHQVAHLLSAQRLIEIKDGVLKRQHQQELKDSLSKISL